MVEINNRRSTRGGGGGGNFLCLKMCFLAVVFFTAYQTIISNTVKLGDCVFSSDAINQLDGFITSINKISTSETESSISVTKRAPLNPWKDFIFSRTNETSYSTHQCVQAGPYDRRTDAASRVCWYQNLYYHYKSRSFHYYPRPKEVSLWKHYNMDDIQNTMGAVVHNLWEEGHSEKFSKTLMSDPFIPKIHLKESIPTNFKRLSTKDGTNPVFMLFRTSLNNFGHIVWDDFLSLFTQLDLHDLQDDRTIQPVPFLMDPHPKYNGYLCHPNNANIYGNCLKFYRRIYPSVWHIETDCSGDLIRDTNWLLGEDKIGSWNSHKREPCNSTSGNGNTLDVDYVLIPNMTVGAGRSGLFSCYGECTIGRGPQLLRFRNYMMRNILGEQILSHTPIGTITFSLAHGATRGAREVSFFEKEIEAAQRKYGHDAVKAVDIASLSMEEQAKLLGDTIIFFTNHGGGSAATTFLPKGACAIIYFAIKKRDIDFYNTVSYFRTRWVDKPEREDLDKIMSIVDFEVEKSALFYPNLLAARNITRR